jgi:hypothetical protein
MAVGDGIEELTIENTKGSNTAQYGMVLINSVRCWIKGTRGIEGNRNQLWVRRSLQASLEDNYLWGAKGSGMQNYGIEVGVGAMFTLIQNNFCSHTVGCFLAGGSVGSVWSYGYAHDAPFGDGAGLNNMQALMQPHAATAALLSEGNNVTSVNIDSTHGPAMGPATIYRNRMRSQDIPTKNANLRGFINYAFNRTTNVVGNVAGTSTAGHPNGTPVRDLWWIGRGLWQNGTNNTGNMTGNLIGWLNLDYLSIDSALGWGNWDIVTNGTRWCGNSSNTNWSTRCRGLVDVKFVSAPAAAISGGSGTRCWVRINNSSGAGGSGYFVLTGAQTIAPGTEMFITGRGSDWGNPPTGAAGIIVQGNSCGPGSGSAELSNIQIDATLGEYSEIPAITTTFANYNPVPTKGDVEAGQPPLPASLYLNQKPTFWRTHWGEPGWPAIGPDVDAANGSGGGDSALNGTCAATISPTDPLAAVRCDGRAGLSYQIPSQICLANSPIDQSRQQTYHVQSITYTGTTARLTVTEGSHNIPIRGTVAISGVEPAGWNGLYILMASNLANGWFEFWRISSPGTVTNPGVGIVSYPNIKNFNARTCYPDDFPTPTARATHKGGSR